MAILNELGRNSASITYGSVTTGADVFPTFGLVDKWLRNDTLLGTATATASTVTGVSSMFLTQLKANDIIMLAGQKRKVAAITSDSSFTVTADFSPAVTIAGTIKVLNPVVGSPSDGTQNTQLAGTVSNVDATYGNYTAGVVNVIAGDNNIYGTNTFFRSECTNAVTTTAMTNSGATALNVSIATNGTITGTSSLFQTGTATQILQPGDSIIVGTSDCFVINTVTSDTSATVKVAPGSVITGTVVKADNSIIGRTIIVNGRVRQITNFVSNTQITVNVPFDFTDSNLQFKMMPRGTVAVTTGSNVITGTGTNFKWDIPSGSQVWVGDELRTFTWSGSGTAQFTGATASDPTGFVGAVSGNFQVSQTGMAFRRDDSYLTYTPNVQVLSDELRVNDDIIINGYEMTVTQIVSDTQFRVNNDLPQMSGATVYKKKKLHGYVLEGTREGQTTVTASKYAGAGSTTYVVGTALAGTNSIVVSTAGAIATAATYTVGNFIKIQNGGGNPYLLTGLVYVSANTVTGIGTAFTTQLHVGAEVCIGGYYGYVSAISSATSMTLTAWTGSITVGASNAALPIYRTMPLNTYITNVVAGSTSSTITLYHTLKNSVYLNSTFGPGVLSPSAVATDYIEYVYSAPNKQAEASYVTMNKSYDRKYFGFRYYPFATTGVFTSSNCAYNVVVYERWAAAWGQAGGVGLNKADYSDGTTALNNVTDQTAMFQQTGGYLYLFAKPRYFIIQGKAFAGTQQQWLGCIEFERAQAEDVGSGVGTATPTGGQTGPGYTYYGAYSAAGYTITPTVSPFPCFAYFNSNRFPVGSTQVPTAPVNFATTSTPGVHGGIYSVPRIKNSAGDLVGINAHIYTAATITTGRWGHLYEMGASGAYIAATATTPIVAANGIAMTTNTVLQPHLGQLVPVNTNVYNSKRFMFSPVIVLGPTWDPDIRGRMFGLKVIPSNLGTLMDTVSVTIESTNDFYDSTGSATDHWVITAPGVTTYRFSIVANQSQTSGYRSLEDTASFTQGTPLTPTTFTNNFRFAIPT